MADADHADGGGGQPPEGPGGDEPPHGDEPQTPPDSDDEDEILALEHQRVMRLAAAQEEAAQRRVERSAQRKALAEARAQELAEAQGRGQPAVARVLAPLGPAGPVAQQRMESEMAPRPSEFNNSGGENELPDWLFGVERTMQARATPHANYASMEAFALSFVSRDVHDWFRARMLERAQEGKGPLRCWDDFRTLFEETYRKHNEADASLRNLLTGGAARMLSGATLVQHLTRMSGLRARIPESIIDVSAFNESVLAGLSDACNRARVKVKRALAKYRKENEGKSFSFTKLKELLFEEHMDAMDYGAPAPTPVRATVAAVAVYDAKGEIAALRAQLASMASQQSAAPGQQLHAMRGEGSGARGQSEGTYQRRPPPADALKYSYGARERLFRLDICIRCGRKGHYQVDCPDTKPTDLTHLLEGKKGSSN